MRILFQMPSPVYLRMYGSTLTLLAERGHRVLLSYDKPDKQRTAAAAAVEDREGIELVKPVPGAKRKHDATVGQLRVAIDYLRYLDRRNAGSPYLRRRLDDHLHGPLKLLRRLPYGMPLAGASTRALLAVEGRVSSAENVERAIEKLAPDAIVITPLLGRSARNRRQTDTVKAARALGIPVAAAVATWDQLTTKGVIKELPDRVFVWNEIQRRDAAEYHRVPSERVVVTGAQLFDRWFERQPSTSREEFLARVGLDGRYVVYVGSSPNIAPPALEMPFVRRWVAALRESSDLANLGVLVRPHPYNVEAWAQAGPPGEDTAIVPMSPPAVPMTEDDQALYFDSLHYADAVVGINTTAMVESFVQRRPVLTVHTPEFKETQEGTLHFGNLASASGGALREAATLDEHLEQLRAVVEAPEASREGIEAFLLAFVRPHGLDRPATPILVDAIEELAGSPARPQPDARVAVRS
jgi:hypothetical protein